MTGSDRLVVTIAPSAALTALAILSLVFVPMIGGLGAMMFLVAGSWLMLRRPWALVGELRAWSVIFLIPFWCALSALWSAEPGLTLRYALQLTATFAIAMAMASRLSALTFFRVILLAYAVAALASIAFGTVRADGGGWIGIFGSKNSFAAAMSVLVLAGLALALDGARPVLERALGALAVAGGGVLLGLGQSAGASLTTLLVGVLGAGLFLFRRLSAPQKRVAVVLCLAVGLSVLTIGLAERAALVALVLEQSGKDVTLTGRTDLWEEARRQIAAAPMLGRGYQAFWVQGNPVAEQLWADFDITSRRGFHFHNLYLSNTVEIGIIGLALQLTSFFGALWLCLAWAIRIPRAETVFLAMMMLRLAVMSMVEVPVYFQFDMNTLFAVTALVFGLRAQRLYHGHRAPQTARLATRRAPGIF